MRMRTPRTHNTDDMRGCNVNRVDVVRFFADRLQAAFVEVPVVIEVLTLTTAMCPHPSFSFCLRTIHGSSIRKSR